MLFFAVACGDGLLPQGGDETGIDEADSDDATLEATFRGQSILQRLSTFARAQSPPVRAFSARSTASRATSRALTGAKVGGPEQGDRRLPRGRSSVPKLATYTPPAEILQGLTPEELISHALNYPLVPLHVSLDAELDPERFLIRLFSNPALLIEDRVKGLSLRDTALTDDVLWQVLRADKIEVLDLGTDPHVTALPGSELRVRSSTIEYGHLHTMLANLRELRELDLSYYGIVDETFLSIAGLPLVRLNLEGNVCLPNWCSNLPVLEHAATGYRFASFRSIALDAFLRETPTLRELNLNFTDLTDELLELFIGSPLEVLRIDGNDRLTEPVIRRVLSSMPNLRDQKPRITRASR